MEDHQELQDENDELTTEIDDLQEELEDSDKARAELQSQYTKLLEMYNEIRVLSWTFFIVDNIEVNLTTVKNEYTSIEDITGSTTMYYTSGEPFNGSFSLILWKVSPPQGVTSDGFEIYGETDYVFESPFIGGAGRYELRVREIRDAEGNVIASYTDLQNYSNSIPILLG
jgi:predicted  nucleic acid-binding Zn-ribbon protein